MSGVHLVFDGEALFLSQAHNRRILALNGDGAILREMRLDRVPVGMTIIDKFFYLITGDKKFKNLELTTLDPRGETPVLTSLASIPFNARGLTYDGSQFWTGHRDANEIVAFTAPISAGTDGL